MPCSTSDHWGCFESTRTESYLDQQIFCGFRDQSQNTKPFLECNRHVFHTLYIYNQYKIDKYKVKFFVGSPNSFFTQSTAFKMQ